MKAQALFIIHSPHRSLYPTWFRWKPSLSESISNEPFFISHMVQMKGVSSSLITSPRGPLYPTWFRWKAPAPWRTRTGRNTLYPTWFRWKSILLRFLISSFGFISHMVQMKASFLTICPIISSSALYPTWFRWKFFRHYLSWDRILSLYPTWFRWKEKAEEWKSTICYLYIPHGSDESNNSSLHIDLLKGGLYIPHGSDESRTSSKRSRCLAILYIPHGSDESDFVEVCIASNSNFISHMVQMKAIKTRLQTIKIANFISHMVQMKGCRR